MSDEEPERYHEWILWKLKQEKKMSEEQLQLNFFDRKDNILLTHSSPFFPVKVFELPVQ